MTPGMQVRVVNSYDAAALWVLVKVLSSVDCKEYQWQNSIQKYMGKPLNLTSPLMMKSQSSYITFLWHDSTYQFTPEWKTPNLPLADTFTNGDVLNIRQHLAKHPLISSVQCSIFSNLNINDSIFHIIPYATSYKTCFIIVIRSCYRNYEELATARMWILMTIIRI